MLNQCKGYDGAASVEGKLPMFDLLPSTFDIFNVVTACSLTTVA